MEPKQGIIGYFKKATESLIQAGKDQGHKISSVYEDGTHFDLDLYEWIDATVVKVLDEDSKGIAILKEFQQMAKEGRFEEISMKIARYEISKEAAASGRRYYSFAADGVLRSLSSAIEASQRKFLSSDFPAILHELSLIEDASQRLPKNCQLAAIAASANHLVAFAYRGENFSDRVSAKKFAKFDEHFIRADDFIAQINTHDASSILLAEARYNACIGNEDNGATIRERFEELRILDPDNLGYYAQHADKLHPKWFGTFDEIELFARKSMAQTDETWGAGAYAAIWQEALDCHPELWGQVDINLLEESVFDLVDKSESQALASIWACFAYTHSDEHECPQRILSRLIRKNIGVFCPAYWDNEVDHAYNAVYDVFSEDIHKGMKVTVKLD